MPTQSSISTEQERLKKISLQGARNPFHAELMKQGSSKQPPESPLAMPHEEQKPR